MITGDAKRIVIVKNISSDLIEEAILILKPEYVVHKSVEHSMAIKSIAKNRKELLLKEAEVIINNYIRENRLNIVPARNLAHKLPAPGKRMLISLIINLLMISSIALLIYVTVKLF